MGTPSSGSFGEILQRMGEDSAYLSQALEARESRVLDQEVLIVEKLVQALKPVLKYIDTSFRKYSEVAASWAFDPVKRGVLLSLPYRYVILTREGKFLRRTGRDFHDGEEWSPAEFCRNLVGWNPNEETPILITLIRALLEELEGAREKIARRDEALQKREALLSEVLKVLGS